MTSQQPDTRELSKRPGNRTLRATLVMLNPLEGDELVAALHALGPSIEELDRAAHDAGFRLRVIVMPTDEQDPR
jgi:hypothetical protein